jgi:hypothetical protein
LQFNYTYAQQNLVPNGSFEDTVSCPLGYADFVKVKNWYSASDATPDYFNECSVGDVAVPTNDLGRQYAQDGKAYAGIGIAYDSIDLNYREYIQVKLKSNLLQNKKYSVSYYISLSDSSCIALKNIGVLFTNTMLFQSGGSAILIQPQFEHNNLITDKINWQKIEFIYNATGNENYLTIGNFHSNNNFDTLTVYSGQKLFLLSYYYLDNIVIKEYNDIIESEPIIIT